MNAEPQEHARFRQHLRDLEQVSSLEESNLVADVLRDPDQTMAVSAVLHHLDRRAAGLDGDEFASWAARITVSVGGCDLLVGRIHDWSQLKAVMVGVPVDTDTLVGASDWLQRKIAETATSLAVLTTLAEVGRTRRVRNTAKIRARRPST